MRRCTIALLRIPNSKLHISASFLSKGPPPSPSLTTLPCCPEAGEVGALETKKPCVRKARKLKADTHSGSLHAELPSSIAQDKAKSRPKAKRRAKAGAEPTELSDNGVLMAEDAITRREETTTQNAATGKAEHPAFHVKSVFEEERAVQNAAIDDGAEAVAFDATANESLIKAKKELSQWVAKQDLNTFKTGRRWEEIAYKMLELGISPAHIMKMLPKCRALRCSRSADCLLKHLTVLGVSRERIGHLITHYPSILAMSSHAFQSKLEFFESVGIDKHFHRRNICLLTYRVLGLSLSTLKGRCNFWKVYFQDVQDNALCTLISSNPLILGKCLRTPVIQNIAFLEELGFSKKMLLKLRGVLGWVLWSTTLKLQARLHTLLVLGFSFDQVQKIPQLLFCSEDHINLSYEKTIKYRYEVLQELKAVGAYTKNISLGYMIRMSEDYFHSRFVGALQAYTKPSEI